MTAIPTIALLLAGQAWTVDDDGPAQFAAIQPAIDAASHGDVILVQPGDYSAFALSKGLSILGPAGGPRPMVDGESLVSEAPGFALVGLDLLELVVHNVPLRGRIDDCEIGHTGTVPVGSLNSSFRISDCAQIELTRTIAQGKSGNPTDWESPGLEIFSSVVAVTDCEIYGGPGGDDPFGLGGYPGERGIELNGTSTLLLSGSSVFGGPGGPCIPFGGYSQGGDAILIDEPGRAVIRGSSFDWIAGGGSCGSAQAGWALVRLGEVVLSGVSVSGFVGFGLDLHQPSPAEPYLEIGGSDLPGAARRVKLYGSRGLPAVVAASTADALLSLPSIDGLVWLDPLQIAWVLPMQTHGQDLAATVLIALPGDPTLAGVSATFQAAFPTPSGGLLSTNPSNIVLRF